MWAHLLLILCALIVAKSQVSSIGTLTTNQELQDTILPCTTKFYKWRVTAPSSLYYLEVNLTTINSVQLNIALSKQQPSDQLNGGVPLDKPTPQYCAAARSSTPPLANSLISLEEYCEVSDGDWYVSIESVGATSLSTFRLIATPKALPTPTEIFINNDETVAGTAVTVRPATGSIFDNNDFYFFDIAKKPLVTPGSRIRVEVVPDSQPNSTIQIFMNLNRIALPPSRIPGATECAVFPGMTGTTTLTLSACVYKQGGKWYLTVDRNPNIVRSYTMKVYVEAPVLQDFNALTNSVFYSLKKEKDIIYFRYTGLDAKITDSTFVAVVDNVVNGRVTLGVLQNSPPFQDCLLADRLCDTDVSCHITNYPCGRTPGTWFFGVRADSLINPNEPLTFTLQVYISPSNVTTIPSTSSVYPAIVRRNQYVTFKMSKPAGKGDWLQVHVFVDYTRLLVPADVQLYVGTNPLVGSTGDGSCFSSVFGPCTATRTVKDVGSCSIQLDPCQLARLSEPIYIGVKGIHTGAFTYFYTQDFIAFTLSVEITNPTQDPYLIKQDTALIHNSVEETQYRLYSVAPFAGNFQIQAEVTDERSSAGIEVFVVPGTSEVEGPSCKCWNPISRVNVTANGGPVVVYQSDVCQSSIQNGLFIAVRGTATPTSNFTFTERQFSLLTYKTTSPNGNLLTPTSLLPKAEKLFQSGKNYFVLAFPRENLMSKSLAITLRSSTLNATVNAQLYRFPSLPNMTCDVDKASSVVSWSLQNFANQSDPDFFTAVQNCIFEGDRDGAEYVIAVDARSGTTASVPTSGTGSVTVFPTAFTITFEIVDKTPRALQSGVAYSGGLRQSIYEHFYLDVTPAQSGRNNLVVEAYFDAGVQEGENTAVMMFVNTPTLAAPAGSNQLYLTGETTSCYCNEYALSDRRKIVFTVNACNLKVGRYYFSLLTRQVAYTPAQYTITATLKPGLVGQLDFDFPINFAAYVGQPFSFSLTIPPEMLSSTTYTGRVLRIKADNTRPNDAVALYLSRSIPSDISAVNTSTCSCYSVLPSFTCTTDSTTSCRINQEFCSLAANGGSGTWYLTTFVKQAEDPKNPVGFTLFASNKNDHDQVLPVPVSATGCGATGRAVKVNNRQYQYFSIDTTGLGLTGQENFEVKIRNLKAGVISIVTGKNNLPTLGCGSLAPLQCTTADCDLRLPCGALDATHLGVYATSSANNDPVEFEILLCFSAVKSITLNSPALQNQKLAKDGSQSYKVDRLGMAALNVSRGPIVSAILSKYSLSPATASHDFVLSTGRCLNCLSTFTEIQGVTRRRCGSADSDNCEINLFGCNLPSNYGSLDWYVDINNGATALTEIQYNFELKTFNIGDSVIALRSGQDTPVSIQPGAWAVASWTIAPTDITTANSILQRAEIGVTGGSATVSTYVGVGTIAFPTCFSFANQANYVLQQCCVQPQTYYVTIRNTGPTASSVTLSPKLTPTAGFVTTSWNRPTGSAAVSATVTQIDNTEALMNAIVPFPGLPDGGNVLYVQVSNDDTNALYNKLYIEKNAIAGPTTSGCYTAGVTADVTVSQSTPYFANFYACSEIPPAEYYFGLSRTQTGVAAAASTNWNISMYIVPAVTVPYNQSFTSAPHVNVNQHAQFMVTIPSDIQWTNRRVRFNVTLLSEGSLVFSVNQGRPAGSTADGCRGTLRTSSVVTTSSPQSLEFTSCTLVPGGVYYIGIEPRTITGPSFSYNISVTDFDASPVAPTNIFLDVPLGVSIPAGGSSVIRLPGIPSFSSRDYFVFSVSVQSAANLPDVVWNVNGDCTQFNSSFKDGTRATDPITAVTIFPCEMQTNTDYFFTVNAPTGLGVTGFANIKKYPGAPYFINVNEAFSASMNEFEVAFLNLKLSPNDILPGQNLLVTLANVSCGTVEAWINRGTTAGPTCNFKNSSASCATAGCQILSLDACEMDDWSDEWWITVRATHQNVLEIPIKFTVSVAVVGSPSFRTIHTNEKHTIYATKLVTQTVQQQCSAQLIPTLAPCCDTVAPAAPNVTLTLENVHLVYPVEGAFMLDSDHTLTLSLTDFVGRATLYISPHFPKFCRNQPLPQPIEATCTATFNSPCTVRLSPATRSATNTTACSWVDGVRQIYVWVDPSSIIFRRAISDTSIYPNGRVPVLNVISNKEPYSITAVAYSSAPNYLQFSLSAKETQYIRVDHPDFSNIKNYHFTASVSYSTGSVQLSGEWSACRAGTTCTDSACTTLNPGVAQDKCAPQTLCSCAITYYRCQVTASSSSRFAIHNPGNSPVDASIRISFTQPEEQLNNACEFVEGASQRWYLPTLTPAARQIYKFDIQYFIDFESQANAIGVTGRVDLIVDGGRPAFNNSPCASLTRTFSTGTQSTILYRQGLEPHLGVIGQTGIAKNHYKITASLLDVNVTTLVNGVVYTSPSVGVDSATQCAVTRTFQWFLFPSALAQRGGVLLVQLWAASGSVYMNPDYVTYRWSPSSTQMCTTGSTGYCFFIVGCGYTPAKDYYFHVDSSVFSFSVTFVPNPTSIMLTMNDTIYLDLTPGQFYSYNLNVPATDLPKRDLVISTSATTPGVVPTWVTTGSFNGLDCAVSSILIQTRTPFRISACDLNRNATNFYVNFFLPSPTPVITPACKNTSVVLSAYFTSDGIPATVAAANGPTALVGTRGKTIRVRTTPGTIGVGDVIYARITDVVNGDAVIDSFNKGPHNAAPVTPALGKPLFPCSGCSSAAQFSHVAWQDECFFCTSVHDTVFVDTRPTVAAPAGNLVNYNLEVTKTSWTPLSSTWRSVTLADNKGITDHAGALAFFRATFSQAQAQQIDVQVTSGSSVLVQIYGDCGSTAISYWCYQGSACQLPLPTNLNFGLSPETLGSSRLRIVVSGRTTTFRIRQMSGTNVCTAGPASGFCAGTFDRSDRLVWSLDENSTFTQKDSWASDRYQTLVSAFSCPVVDSCECAPLTQPCQDALRKLACAETFGTCSDQGFRLTMPAQLCSTITQACGKSFTAAGLPEFSCLHSFYYANPLKWVDANGQPTIPPTETSLTITSAAASSAVSMTTSFTSSTFTTSGGVSTAGVTTDGSTGAATSTVTGTAGITTSSTDSVATSGGISSAVTSSQLTTGVPGGNTSNGISNSGASSGLSGGAIAGIIIGVILLLLVIAVVAWIFLRKVSTDGFNQFDDDKYTSILNEELKAEGSFDDSRLL